MDYEYDDYEPYEGRILWGRAAVYAGSLVLVFILGSCIGGRGGVSQAEFEEERARVVELASENTVLQEQLEAVSNTQDSDRPRVDDTATGSPTGGPTDGPGGTGGEDGDPADGVSTYEVQDGDTLYAIAVEVYGDGSKFPLIAQANDLDSDNPLTVGQQLIIPPEE
jgi:nucleoid-associated protein YgaU